MTVKVPDDQKSSAKRPFCPLRGAAREILRSEKSCICEVKVKSSGSSEIKRTLIVRSYLTMRVRLLAVIDMGYR